MKLHEWQAQQAIMKALKIKHASLKSGASADHAEHAAEKFLRELDEERVPTVMPSTFRAGA